MSFLVPAAFFLAGLLPVIVILYLLKLRRTEHLVSSTYLWQQMVRDVQANTPWQGLRYNLLLLLQLLILIFLIFALARPFTYTQGISSQTAVFIIDTSASMGATDVSTTRLAAAKDQAHRLVDSLPDRARITLIEAGLKARVLVSSSTDRSLIHHSIDSLEPGSGGSDLAVALQIASAIAARQVDAQTVVLSDGNINLPDRLALHGKLTYLPLGLRKENQAISLLSIHPTPSDGLTAFAQVTNFNDETVLRRIAFTADNQLIDTFDLELAPGASQSVLAQNIPTTTQQLEARLLPTEAVDYLTADDRAVTIVQAGEPVSVTLVTSGNLFLETALTLLPNHPLTRVNPEGINRLPEAGLTILDATLPLTSSLPAGNLLYIGPLSSTEFFSVTGKIPSPEPHPDDPEHPVLEYVDLSGVKILDAARIPLPTWAQAVVVADDPASPTEPVPLMFAGQVDGRRLAVIAFDFRHSDLPLNIAFPILVANLVEFLTPGHGEVPAELKVGEPLSLQLPPSIAPENVTITRPDGGIDRPEFNQGQLIYPRTDLLGVYRLDLGDEKPVFFAVNLFSPQESQIAPSQTLGAIPTNAVKTGDQSQEEAQAKREWWRPLALIALGILTAEWLVYHRPALGMTYRKFTSALGRRAR